MAKTKDRVVSARVTEEVYKELEEISDLMHLPKGNVIALALKNLMNSPAALKIKSGYEELVSLERAPTPEMTAPVKRVPPTHKAPKKIPQNGKVALASVN